MRRGAPPDRRLRAPRRARRRGRTSRGHRLRGQRGAARHCCTTATRWTRTGRSSTRRSCRRPRRTNWRSKTICAASLRATPRLDDDQLRHVCEQAIRNSTRASRRNALPRPPGGAAVSVVVIGVGNAYRGDDGSRHRGRRPVAQPSRTGPRRLWSASWSRRGSWTHGRAPMRRSSSTPWPLACPLERCTDSMPQRHSARQIFGSASTHALGIAEAVEARAGPRPVCRSARSSSASKGRPSRRAATCPLRSPTPPVTSRTGSWRR